MDAVKVFEADRESSAEDDWTEEVDAEFADIIKEVDDLEDPHGFSDEKDAGEDQPEDSEET